MTEDINLLILDATEAAPAIAELTPEGELELEAQRMEQVAKQRRAMLEADAAKETQAMLELEALRVDLYPSAELVAERFVYGGCTCIATDRPLRVRPADVEPLIKQGFSKEAPAKPEKE